MQLLSIRSIKYSQLEKLQFSANVVKDLILYQKSLISELIRKDMEEFKCILFIM